MVGIEERTLKILMTTLRSGNFDTIRLPRRYFTHPERFILSPADIYTQCVRKSL